MSSTRPRHTKSMSSSGHPSKSTLPPIEDNTELKARWAAWSCHYHQLWWRWWCWQYNLPPNYISQACWCARVLSRNHCFYFAAPLRGVPPPLRLHTVLAPQRRTVSLVVPPAAAPSMELSSETGAALPTTAPRPHQHCPMIRVLWLSNAGALPPGSSARSPPSLSAGQWSQKAAQMIHKVVVNTSFTWQLRYSFNSCWQEF